MRPEKRNLASLTGLRWFAALAVFGVHLGFTHGRAGHLTQPGVAGVSFFFVLSGFVLTWSARPGDTLRNFYLRRVARIYPTYVATWLLVLALIPVGLHVFYGRPFAIGLFLLQSWSPNHADYYGGNGLGWSLSCEAFFYLMFPFVVALLRRCSNTGLIVTAAAGFALMAALNIGAWVLGDAAAIKADRSHWVWLVFIFPPVRFLEFLLGCVAAMLVARAQRVRIPATGAVILAGAAYVLSDLAPDVHVATAIPVLPFALVVCAFAARDLRSEWTPFTARWLVVLGQWSFAFYLVHQMVLRYVRHLIAVDTIPLPNRHIYTDTLGLIVAIAAAAVLHYVVERPAERRIRALSGSRGKLPVSG